MTITAGENDGGRRLDRILRKHFTELPLSLIARLLRSNKVTVNGTARQGAYRVCSGETIVISGIKQLLTPQLVDDRTTPAPASAAASAPAATAAPLDIIYEDGDFLVVNKPKGLLTHRPDGGKTGTGHERGSPPQPDTLACMVAAYLTDKIERSLSFRPGPLHRLDRNTCGLVVCGKSLKGARFFSEALRAGQVRKFYHALVDGVIDGEAEWVDLLVRDDRAKKTGRGTADAGAPAGGKRAVTRVRPLKVEDGRTVIEAEILTGRTHQIRAQCALHGHPLSGDTKYGGSFRADGYELTAVRIETFDRIFSLCHNKKV